MKDKTKLLDGIVVSQAIKEKLKQEVLILKKQNINPKLLIISVGNLYDCNLYLKKKQAMANELGIEIKFINLDINISLKEFKEIVTTESNKRDVHGVLIQMPLPKHLTYKEVVECIPVEKDVDCFRSENLGKLWFDDNDSKAIKPCVGWGVLQLLNHYQLSLKNKNVLLIRLPTDYFIKPIIPLFLNEKASVTCITYDDKNLDNYLQQADMVVIAIGRALFLKTDKIKNNCIIIDIGINRLANNKVIGDVDINHLSNNVSYISPVPGGVGPMTVISLMRNLIVACKNIEERE